MHSRALRRGGRLRAGRSVRETWAVPLQTRLLRCRLQLPLPCAVLGSRLQEALPVPPRWDVRGGERALHLQPRALGRAVPVPLPLRPPRPLRPHNRRLPLRAGLVGSRLQEAVPVQPRHLALRHSHRALPLPAGLVGQEVQVQVLLQPLTLRPGDGQLQMQGWFLGVGVPVALRLRARLLQSSQWVLQL